MIPCVCARPAESWTEFHKCATLHVVVSTGWYHMYPYEFVTLGELPIMPAHTMGQTSTQKPRYHAPARQQSSAPSLCESFVRPSCATLSACVAFTKADMTRSEV